jgi:hypothetical protein
VAGRANRTHSSLTLRMTLPYPCVGMYRALAPWLVAALVACLFGGLIPSALADSGGSALEAIPVHTDGSFGGSVAGTSSRWFSFGYSGTSVDSTVTITYLPADANLMDVLLYSGDPHKPTAANTGSQQTGNSRSSPYKDTSAHQVFIKIVNGNANRTVTFTGTVSPTAALATATPIATAPASATPATTTTPAPATPTATMTGPVPTANATPATGDSGPAAITVGADGVFVGTISQRRAIWYRFWYGNAGASASVTVSVSPNASGADLNFYTGHDPNNLSQQGGGPNKAQNQLSRDVSLASAQYVYFAIANNNDSTGLGYSGTVAPAFAPVTLTSTPTATATNTSTPSPTPTPTNTPVPTSTPTSAPTAVPTDTPTAEAT